MTDAVRMDDIADKISDLYEGRNKEQSINDIIDAARRERARRNVDWHTYEKYKRMIRRVRPSCAEYDAAIRRLCDALKL